MTKRMRDADALDIDSPRNVSTLLRCDAGGVAQMPACPIEMLRRALAECGTFFPAAYFLPAPVWDTRPACMADMGAWTPWWRDPVPISAALGAHVPGGPLVAWSDAASKAWVFEPVPALFSHCIQDALVHVYAHGIPVCTVRPDGCAWLCAEMFASKKVN
jgi:hypothetical protein